MWNSLLRGGVLGWEVELCRNTLMLSQVTEPRSDEAGVAL